MWQDTWDGTTRQDSLDGHLEQDHTDRTARTQSGKVNLTGEQWRLGKEPEQDNLAGQSGQDSWDRTAGIE
jgi:hypothetical protein